MFNKSFITIFFVGGLIFNQNVNAMLYEHEGQKVHMTVEQVDEVLENLSPVQQRELVKFICESEELVKGHLVPPDFDITKVPWYRWVIFFGTSTGAVCLFLGCIVSTIVFDKCYQRRRRNNVVRLSGENNS